MYDIFCIFAQFLKFAIMKRLVSIVLICLSVLPLWAEYRGLVVIPSPRGNVVSWRLLKSEKNAEFAVYRDNRLWRMVGSDHASCLVDSEGKPDTEYRVCRRMKGANVDSSRVVRAWQDGRLTIQTSRPEGKGEYAYYPGDCSVGDLDGDGEPDIVLKWDPRNAHDNSHRGLTGEVIIDAYRLNGEQLWRIRLGQNIRAGAHYTQFLVYDFDADGCAEVVVRTAPGCVDGTGKPVLLGEDKVTDDYRITDTLSRSYGYILTTPEYLTVFRGRDGANIATVPFEPQRGEVASWGDSYGNRCDRFLACAASLDGYTTSIVMCRGYYTKQHLAAYDFDGTNLTLRWIRRYDDPSQPGYGAGNHNLSVADVDGDGRDEIIYGSCAFDDDGSVLYDTGLGHGDAIHVGKLIPSRKGLQVFDVHEDPKVYATYGAEVHDARTGEIIWYMPSPVDNGRGLAADIDATYPGHEMWSWAARETFDCNGKKIADSRPKTNFRIYWDGDLQDELLNHNKIYKWKGAGKLNTIAHFESDSTCNGSKYTPCLMADIMGDWREEVLLFDKTDPSVLHLYATPYPTDYRIFSLMEDHQYRMSVVWQNVSYNQPPHLSFWLGAGADKIPWKK